MGRRTTITVRTEVPCAECRKGGATDNRLCLPCTTAAMNETRAMRSVEGKVVQARWRGIAKRGLGRRNLGTAVADAIERVAQAIAPVSLPAEAPAAPRRGWAPRATTEGER
jgi:hypothetical protein